MRKRGAQKKVIDRRGSNSKDFISKMPDEILLMILSLIPQKDAVVTSSLSKRWKFLWCNLSHLNFDGGEVLLEKMAKNPNLRDSERSKFMNQVDSFIRSHNGPVVQEFRIRFDLDDSYKNDIDYWLKFAVNKKVEILELDLMDYRKLRTSFLNYAFPLRLSTADATIVQLQYLKTLVLKGVNVREAILQEFLTNSPHLETLSIQGSRYLTHVAVGGKALNLKHFSIAYCSQIESIYLYEFDLLSFSYKGLAVDLRLANLPNIKELDICQGLAGLQSNLFTQIASCVSYIQVLSLNIYSPMKSLMLNSISRLLNVRKLKLTIGAHNDNCLLDFASLANACPSLETFTFELLWCSPIRRKRKVRHGATSTHPYNRLRLLEVMGYYGRMSDLELVMYIIENAVALKEIVIDPRCQGRIGNPTIGMLKTEETARSYAHSQLKSITPQGVKLVIL